MFGFLIKKTFFDMWDNMLNIVVMNLGFLLIASAMLYIPFVLSFNLLLASIAVVVGIIVITLYTGAVAYTVGEYADYRAVSFKEFFSFFKQSFKSSLALGIVAVVEVIILRVVFPFYFQMGGLLGLGAMAAIFWVSVIWALASQYYFPVAKRLDTDIKKIFRKSFILFFDNTLYSVGLGIVSLIILTVSLFTAFLLPGVASFLLFHQVACKLRMYKYDYLEENPDTKKRDIPWAALLLDDKDKVGPRTLKGMLFPWKD